MSIVKWTNKKTKMTSKMIIITVMQMTLFNNYAGFRDDNLDGDGDIIW